MTARAVLQSGETATIIFIRMAPAVAHRIKPGIQKGWSQPPEYFQARTKYLQLADKAARTVMMLTERLDHHRGRGQQQITVKHVTTNNVTADQAIIAESVTTGAGRNAASPALLANSSEIPMPTLSETRVDPVGEGGGTKSK
jgi:hypothetical protein